MMPSIDDFKDYYEILGVSPGASDEEIKKAWKKKMKMFHPDRYADADEETKEYATEMAKLINEAYQVLKDPERRKEYDIKMGFRKPPVVSPGPSAQIYSSTTPNMVYTSQPPIVSPPVYEVIDIAPADEVIIEEIFEEPVFETPISERTKKERTPVKETKKKPIKKTSMEDYTIPIVATIGIITIVLTILILPFFIPGMPSIIPMATSENNHTPEGPRDSDRDGVPDDIDIYPYGNGVLYVTITYFEVVNNPSHEKINPYFKVRIDGNDLPNSTIYYGEDTITDPVGPFSWDIEDSATSVSILVAAYSFSSTGDDELVDIDPSPYYNRYERINIAELKKGPIIRNWDGAEDGDPDELDAIIIYKIEIKGENFG